MNAIESEYPDDPRMIGEYRPFSFFSLAALFLAVFSSIALVNRQFIPLPIITAVVALASVFSVEMRATKPTGGFLGYLALFLATTIGAGSLCYDQLYERHLISLARQFAEQWLGKVQAGEIYLPYELTKENITERLPFDTDLVKYYGEVSSDTKQTIQAYKILEPELSIRRAGKGCELEFVKELGRDENLALKDFIVLQYRIVWKDVGRIDGQPLDESAAAVKKTDWIVSVTMMRIDAVPPLGPQWLFKSINCDEPKFERKLPSFGTT